MEAVVESVEVKVGEENGAEFVAPEIIECKTTQDPNYNFDRL